METLFTPDGLQRSALLMLLFIAVAGGAYVGVAWFGERRVARERLDRSSPSALTAGDAPSGGNLRPHDARGAAGELPPRLTAS